MPEHVFITEKEVQVACKEIGISDWSKITDGKIETKEAETVREIVGGEALEISVEEFRTALEVELEHGTKFPDANVSGNHPIATGRIVLAHLKESLDYYLRLNCMELEMDLTKALVEKNLERSIFKRRELANAREALEKHIANQLQNCV